jgi:hypothetical protein
MFMNADEDEAFVCNFSSEVTLDDVQLRFREWMRRLEWVSEHDGVYVPAQTSYHLYISLSTPPGRVGGGDFFAPLHSHSYNNSVSPLERTLQTDLLCRYTLNDRSDCIPGITVESLN